MSDWRFVTGPERPRRPSSLRAVLLTGCLRRSGPGGRHPGLRRERACAGLVRAFGWKSSLRAARVMASTQG